ncbi:hypothetical protein BDW02DRAFT_645047 [Decorospora gaudefroyi]|uniref:Subtelomeric hrmA-associated cluster protein AFUB-079030/YDR124W-like helical bundle domain-containing protein n=1 Tax=Decorospora gaudefroyi TaxID=184978 RepID=A0A6A5KHR9_9PLEO|nr:hypothetical protein BDW02DRAFT_645047 [Decorospora gaudefroyi]
MGRSRAADRSGVHSKEGRPTRVGKGGPAKKNELGQDAWATVYGGKNGGRESQATHADEATVTVKVQQDEQEDHVVVPVLPTAIAQGPWKITSPDGREHIIHQPIPGLEHLWHGAVPSQGAVTTPGPRQQTLKRSRSNEREPTTAYLRYLSDDDNEEEGNVIRGTTEHTRNFYIGNRRALQRFFRQRLVELTMKPLRPIVTAWIKQLEPRRLSRYGPYHKKLARTQPPGSTPPWWPRNVPYEEPSHLDKTSLLALAVDLMLQHRVSDAPKRREPWAEKMREQAVYAVKSTPPDQFSSSKGPGFSQRMRGRALSEILPSLFDVAQSYEDHLVQYQLYDGSGHEDPKTGKRVSWRPLARPSRQPAPKKRLRTSRGTPAPKIESDDDASGDETEVDDTMTDSEIRRARKRAQVPVPAPYYSNPPASHWQAPVPAHMAAPTVSPQDMRPDSSTTTPNTSFGQSMHGLQLGESMDLDVQAQNQNAFPSGPPMHYSPSRPSFSNHTYPSEQDGGPPSTFVPGPPPGYEQAFEMYHGSYPPHFGDVTFTDSVNVGHVHFPYSYHQGYPPHGGLEFIPSYAGDSCH